MLKEWELLDGDLSFQIIEDIFWEICEKGDLDKILDTLYVIEDLYGKDLAEKLSDEFAERIKEENLDPFKNGG